MAQLGFLCIQMTMRCPASRPPPPHPAAGAVIVDESLTSGSSYWALSRGCPQFSHLTLTGVLREAHGKKGMLSAANNTLL